MSTSRAQKKRRNKLRKGSGVSANLIITLSVVAVAAILIGGAVWYSQTRDNEEKSVSDGILVKPDSNRVVTPSDSSESENAENAVTVVEFLDYQCPACNAYYHNVIQQLEEDYKGKITFVTRNYPLENIHPLARPAAQAAEAAGVQGKFSEMYHALYDNYDAWAVAADGRSTSDDVQRAQQQFESYAANIGVNIEQFRTDMVSVQVQKRIDQDVADGDDAGVESTPTLFVNGKKFNPSGNSFDAVQQQLYAKIDEELEP